MKKVAVYVRVSTVGQNEEGQIAEIQKWLTGNGISPHSVEWITDKQTGDNLERPGFKYLQERIFMGDVSTVVVYKLDRLSRKLQEGLNVLCDWCERGIRVVSVTQQLDFSGAVGQLLGAVLLGIAQMEQETRRERQKAGIEVAKKAGKFRGRKPGATKVNPSKALKLRLKGLTTRAIANELGVSMKTVTIYLRKATKPKATDPEILSEALNERAI